MDLWIRSQNKTDLVNVHNIYITDSGFIRTNRDGFEIFLGKYSSSRALEVLDEIQNKIKTLLYLKPTCILETSKIEAAKHYYEDLNDKEFITCDNNFEIIPFSTNVIVYEMPEE